MTDSTPLLHGAVLCAGFGTRMHPITEALPKPLIPFLNTPLVTYAINHLTRAGIEEIGFNLHHLADAVPPVVDRLCTTMGVHPTYVREWEVQGTAGGIRGVWEALGEPHGTLVVLNGDSVMNIDLRDHIARHRASGRDVTLVVRPKDETQPGRVFLDSDEMLIGIRDHRRPSCSDTDLQEYDFTGVHILESHAIERLALEPGDIITSLYGPMIEEDEEAIGVSIMQGFWAALDTPSLYLECTRACLEEPDLFEQAPLPEALGKGLFVYRPHGVEDGVDVASPIFLGAHVEASAGSKLGPMAVVDGAEIAAGTRISNAVIYGMGRIEGEWHDCIAVAGKVISVEST